MSNNPLSLYGKMPPQAIELEEAVLGAIILERDRLEEILEIIPKSECFYIEAHQKVFEAIQALSLAGSAIDLNTVSNQLRKSNELELVGGAYYLTKLTMNVVSTAHAESHARIVMEKYMSRSLITLSSEVIKLAYDGNDSFEVMDEMEKGLQAISDATVGGQSDAPIVSTIMEVLTKIERTMKNKGAITGVSTGIYSLDHATRGWQPCEHIIIAARPAAGKTAFAINMMINAAMAGNPVYYQSLEMSKAALTQRAMAMLAGVDLSKIASGNLTDGEFQAMVVAGQVFAKLPIIIDDRGGVTATQITYKARRLKRKKGIKLVIVDYLQLIRPTNPKCSREQQVAQISWQMKTMAKELHIPVIDLCQMNRSIESDKKRRPNMSDLRESGSLEQDADIVSFLHHEGDEMSGGIKNLFLIVKYREGVPDAHELRFIPSIQKWCDVEDRDFASLPSYKPSDNSRQLPKEDDPF